GEETAKATQNPQLGILGGISILGTSGIVRPMSEDTWKESITLEMQQKKALGLDKLILTPGNYGNDFIAEHTHLNPDYIVQMSN
ncbi:cobalt-precorrin-5B (C(1))-methyltransferase, partial [Streptococcus oralis]